PTRADLSKKLPHALVIADACRAGLCGIVADFRGAQKISVSEARPASKWSCRCITTVFHTEGV
ncbi:MAG TPA: hypothetical protein VH000_11440, partial [Rhizomicrobium sp.]|nr:hypothetical protein [Rhizomicrobium sp.]